MDGLACVNWILIHSAFALCWVLGPRNQVSTISLLKGLKVRVGVEQRRRYPRKVCNKVLTSLMKTRLRMDTTEGQTHVARGGPYTGFTEEVILQGRLVETCTRHAEKQEKELQGVPMPMQRLAEAGKSREIQFHGLQHGVWLVEGMS